jgi:DNA-binding IclR family transcriptional regulator
MDTGQVRIPGGQVLRKAMRVLALFTPDRPELSVTEVAGVLHWPRSSVARLLGAMDRSGFLDRDDVSGRYRVGLRLAALGAVAVDGTSLQRIAQPELAELAQRSGETANISVLSAGEVVNVGLVLSPRPIKHMGWIGRRMPVHATAAGKALVAWREAELAAIVRPPLRRRTARTITRMDDLREELGRVRARGWSSAYGELEDDLVGIGAPIRDHHGDVVACVTISAPLFRVERSRLPELGALVRGAADRISAALGHEPTVDARPRRAVAAR